METRSAVDIALELFRRPASVREHQDAPLPRDVLSVIRLAAGGETDLGHFGADHSRTPNELREASVFFVQQVMFHPKADHYRILGLIPGATSKQIQEHKRALLKWLHPDRNPNKWEQVMFQRVIQSAALLEEKSLLTPVEVVSDRVASHRPRGRPTRQLKRFAAQRVRKPVHWRNRIMKHVKRLAVFSCAVVAVNAAWRYGFSASGSGVPWWPDMAFFNWIKW